MTDRHRKLTELRSRLVSAERVVLTTHVNADGDGAGCEAALGHFLRRRDVDVTIVNPTPYPEQFRFLLHGLPAHTPGYSDGRAALREADLLVVLDTSEADRLGDVWDRGRGLFVAVVDHHPPSPKAVGDLTVRDEAASATGELVYELLTENGGSLERVEAEGLYVAIVTDTGSFQYSNTTPRAHRITADLLERGVDPEAMYRRLYARFTEARLQLLRRALGSLKVDPDYPVAWIVLRHRDLQETGADEEDREGIVEYARRIEGVDVALLFRELPDGRTKVSLRSLGDVNVSEIARRLDGGGHPKASGALVDEPVDRAVDRVLREIRSELHPRAVDA